jgi:hypothetical protein
MAHTATDESLVHDVLDELPETKELPWGRKVEMAEQIVAKLDDVRSR